MVEQLDIFASSCEMGGEKGLSPRQWALYRLIKENSLNGLKTTQLEICVKIPGYKYNSSPLAHDHCTAIWSDINAILLSHEVEKIIIYKDFLCWIATSQEEVNEWLDSKWKELEPRLSRYWFFKQKAEKNGQGKLLSDQLQPIDEKSKARAFVESFIQ